jgi:hypothetical protein
MPAKSENQQQLMAMALMYKRGKMKNASPAVKALAKNMSEKELEKYATTSTKGLPKKLKKEEIVKIFEKFITKVDDSYRIRSAKTGELWPQKYDSYAHALKALKAYQVHKNEVLEDVEKQRIDQISTIIKTNSSGRVDEEVVDVPSANLMMSVYEALTSMEARAKFLKLPVKKMIEVSHKLIK